MGEYAIRLADGAKIKIGTCESMYYLRYDQLDQISAPGYNWEGVRFRFPYPDEDGIAPGDFDQYEKPYPVRGVEIPDELRGDHYSVQFKADNGYLVSLPCPESIADDHLKLADDKAVKIHKNGYGGAVKLVQQRIWNGHLACVLECGGCGMAWRLPELEDAKPYIEAVRENGSSYGRKIAERMEAGYGMVIR